MENLIKIKGVITDVLEYYKKSNAVVFDFFNTYYICSERKYDKEIYKVISIINIEKERVKIERIERMIYDRKRIEEFGVELKGIEDVHKFEYVIARPLYVFEALVPYKSEFVTLGDHIVLSIKNTLKADYDKFDEYDRTHVREIIVNFIEGEKRFLSEESLLKLIDGVLKVAPGMSVFIDRFEAFRFTGDSKKIYVSPFYS